MSFIVIGQPGQPPRLLIPADEAERWDSRNVMEGEVVLECEAPGDFVIAADGSGLEPRAWPLTLLKEQAAGAISAKFRAVMAAGCNTPKGRADCDDVAQQRVTSAVLMADKADAMGLPDTPVPWTMFDKSVQPHNRADLALLGLAIGAQMQAAFARKQQLEAAVESAADPAALAAIAIDDGWPS